MLLAEQRLRERGGRASADELKRLILAAGGSEDEADDAWARRAGEEMRMEAEMQAAAKGGY